MHSEIDSIVLNAPVADVYAYCSRFEELPRFITSLRDVQKIDETHFSFTSLLDGKEQKTVLQIVLRVPERRIAWQAISDNFPRGVVLFEPLSDRTTEITVKLRSSIEPATLAKVTRDYLTNFKRVVERDLNDVNAESANNGSLGVSRGPRSVKIRFRRTAFGRKRTIIGQESLEGQEIRTVDRLLFRLALAAYNLNQTAPGRVCNGFCAADDVHLGEDGFTVRLDGAFTNKQS